MVTGSASSSEIADSEDKVSLFFDRRTFFRDGRDDTNSSDDDDNNSYVLTTGISSGCNDGFKSIEREDDGSFS